jgi:type II secretory pathway component PulF
MELSTPLSTSTTPASNIAFAYQSQGSGDQTFSGTIDAPNIAAAAAKLAALHISYTLLEPAQRPVRSPSKSFGPSDFLAFNRQLGQLTKAGLPIERTLRLMASEMRKPQARAVEQIAAELEKGTPIGEAFASHKNMFPPLYGMLLDAGVRTNNLPGMLLNIGRHVETIQRLRAALWRAASYPLMVLIALALLLSFFWFYLMPEFVTLTTMPPDWNLGPQPNAWVAVAVNDLSGAMLVLVWIVLILVLGTMLVSRSAWGRRTLQPLVNSVPLIGPILRWNLLARWCDALYLGIEAGLDLPAALVLAGGSIDSRSLNEASRRMSEAVSAGRDMDGETLPRLMLPLIPAALQLAARQNDLPAAAANLAAMYRDQAEVRLSVLPQILSPILLMFIAVGVGLAIASMLLPLVMWLRFLNGITGIR